MSTSPELKACPFCNHAAYLATWTERIEIGWDSGLGSPSPMFNTHHEVRCGDKEKFHNAGCGAKVRGDSEAEAIANWNRRASLSEREAPIRANLIEFLQGEVNPLTDAERVADELLARFPFASEGDAAPPRDTREAVREALTKMIHTLCAALSEHNITLACSVDAELKEWRDKNYPAQNSKSVAPRTP